MTRDEMRCLSLAEALPLEIARVREVLQHYKDIGPAGAIGVMMIEQDIAAAEKATRDWDTVAMLRAYQGLQEIEG